MRRRALLAALAATVAGCTGTGDDGAAAGPTATGTATPTSAGTPTPSPTVSVPGTPPTNTAQGFEQAISERVSVRELRRESTTWTLRYHTDVVVGPPFVREQLEIAKQFAAYRPEGVSLSATALHECTAVEWRVPAAVARRYRADEVDVATLRVRVGETTERTND